jgi:hypothetical protein
MVGETAPLPCLTLLGPDPTFDLCHRLDDRLVSTVAGLQGRSRPGEHVHGGRGVSTNGPEPLVRNKKSHGATPRGHPHRWARLTALTALHVCPQTPMSSWQFALEHHGVEAEGSSINPLRLTRSFSVINLTLLVTYRRSHDGDFFEP